MIFRITRFILFKRHNITHPVPSDLCKINYICLNFPILEQDSLLVSFDKWKSDYNLAVCFVLCDWYGIKFIAVI